jgi:hypothetical protein
MLKCSIVESKMVLMLEREEHDKATGSRVTLATGQFGQLPRVIKFFKFLLTKFIMYIKMYTSFEL